MTQQTDHTTDLEIRSVHPVLVVSDVARTRAFYEVLLGLATTFDSDWFVQLREPTPGGVELGAVAAGHPTIPAGWEQAANLIVTVEVDDARVARRRAAGLGAPVVMELRDEDFGQRHFMVSDPDGVLVDVVEYLFVPTGDES